MFVGRENRTFQASGPHSTAISLPVPRTTLGQKQSHFREGNRDSGTEESPVHGRDHVSLHSKIPWHQDEERYAKVQHGVCVPTWHFWGSKVLLGDRKGDSQARRS